MSYRTFFNSIEEAGFTPEFQTVYNSWTTKPSASVASAMDAMVQTIKGYNLWSPLDIFYVYAAHTNNNGEALTNWKTPGTFDGTIVNSPVFTAFEGFLGNGTNSYARTNWDPGTDAVNLALNDFVYGFYNRNSISDSGTYNIYGVDDNINDIRAFPHTAGLYAVRLHYTGTVNSYSNTVTTGMFIDTGTAAATQASYRNGGAAKDTSAISLTGIPSGYNLYVLCYNNAGGGASFTPGQVSVFFAGAGMTQADATNITNAVEAYMDSNGKGVIA
jgi:hypothetical protein